MNRAAVVLLLSVLLCLASAHAERVPLEKLDLSRMFSGKGAPQPGRSVSGRPIRLGGVTYEAGIGVQAQSEFFVLLNGKATLFHAVAGVDDQTEGKGTVLFEVWVDNEKVFDSGVLRGGMPPVEISIPLTGAQVMDLVITDAGDGNDHDLANWADAWIEVEDGAAGQLVPVFAHPDTEPLEIADCTPGKEAALHGPRITGGSPGAPFLHLLGATGEGPMRFSVDSMPPGITLDAEKGILSGTLEKEGRYETRVTVENAHGKDSRGLTVVCGPGQIALTPPMGWNSWFVWAGHVDDAKVRDAAERLAASGLAARGYRYVVIDDTWQADRGEDGAIAGDPERFPDMRALADHIHALGLKFGLYSSPGPGTCAGYAGSYQHEAADAAAYGAWTVDFLKYDWCSYGRFAGGDDRDSWMRPFRLMRDALDATGRDIVFSICQYGRADVWTWGRESGGNLWRTTDDGGDVWGAMANIGFDQDGLEPFAGPNGWNDPDMIQAGWLGMLSQPRPTRLTPNEQITQMTLWSLLASPLFLSCDLSRLDAFTLNLLGNDEVLDVNQDPLGQQGRRAAREGRMEVWTRPLADGTLAVGLFNLDRKTGPVTVKWADLGLRGELPVRDLWRKTDLGAFEGEYRRDIPRHGAALLKIGRPKP